jgi:hypothetical protein
MRLSAGGRCDGSPVVSLLAMAWVVVVSIVFVGGARRRREGFYSAGIAPGASPVTIGMPERLQSE